MNNNTLVTLCSLASIVAILSGAGLIIAALNQAMISEWGDVASGFTPQAILISGGLLALAICGSCSRDQGGNE